MLNSQEIPHDLNACQALIAELLVARTTAEAIFAEQQRTSQIQSAKIAELEAEMLKLQKLLHQLIQGHQSERRILSSDAQSWLPFESREELEQAKVEAEAEAETIIQRYTVEREIRRNKPRSEALPAHLPRVERIAEVAEEIRVCSEHGERTVMGYDVTETLKYIPAKLFVEQVKYPQLVCTGCPACGVTSPERPTSLVEGNRYDTSVAAAIVQAKWDFYMPLYRLQDIFAGSGWTPARSTLLNIVAQVVFVIEPLVQFMKAQVQRDVGVGIDDTSCRMLLPKEIPPIVEGDAKSRRIAEKIAEARAAGKDSLLAKMWVYSGLKSAPYNIFDFRVSRHRDGPDEFFANSQCHVQGDCFSGNTSVVIHSDGRLKFVACWGHARRKLVEASTYKTQSETLIAMIQALYDIETRAKDRSDVERQQLRERESTIVLTAIKAYLESAAINDVLPKSDFGEAVRYIRNHWQALNAYISDGCIPIDNNGVEQLMKQVAMGRRAWLFVGNVTAGERSAMLMSLVSSAKRHDLDVWLYLKDVLDQLLAGCTDYQSLLPDNWKQSHPDAVRTYRQEERRDKADRKQLNAARRRLAAKLSK